MIRYANTKQEALCIIYFARVYKWAGLSLRSRERLGEFAVCPKLRGVISYQNWFSHREGFVHGVYNSSRYDCLNSLTNQLVCGIRYCLPIIVFLLIQHGSSIRTQHYWKVWCTQTQQLWRGKYILRFINISCCFSSLWSITILTL